MGKANLLWGLLYRTLERAAGLPRQLSRETSWFEKWRTSDRKVDVNANLGYNTDWIYACVQHRANTMAGVKWGLFLETARDEYEEVKNHVFYELMYDVNDELAEFDLWQLTQTAYDLLGEMFWYLVPGPFGPSQIVPIFPEMGRMEVHRNSSGIIEGYKLWLAGGGFESFPPEEIFYYRAVNIGAAYRGLGLLNAILRLAALDRFQKEYAINTFKNDGTPSGVLSTDVKLGKDAFNDAAKRYRQEYSGFLNAKKLMFLDGSTTYEAVGLSPKDLDFVNGLNITSDQIIQISGIPRHYFGRGSATTIADADFAETIYMKTTILPQTKVRDSRISQNFLRRFYGEQKRGRLVFRSLDVVPEDRMALLQEDAERFKLGRLTVNEMLEKDGKKPVDGGDVRFIMTGIQPLVQEKKEEEKEEPLEKEPIAETD